MAAVDNHNLCFWKNRDIQIYVVCQMTDFGSRNAIKARVFRIFCQAQNGGREKNELLLPFLFFSIAPLHPLGALPICVPLIVAPPTDMWLASIEDIPLLRILLLLLPLPHLLSRQMLITQLNKSLSLPIQDGRASVLSPPSRLNNKSTKTC